MANYIVNRLLQSIVVLFLISIGLFGLVNSAPGDPITAMISADIHVRQSTDPAILQRQRELLGLDKPWPVRYVLWLGRVVRGELGTSFVSKLPVSEIIGKRIFPTLLLMGTATLVSILIGIPLGIISALKDQSLLDHTLGTVAFLGVSVPGFFLAILALWTFALRIPLFPTFGMKTLVGKTTLPPVADVAWHLTLPMAVLAFERIAGYMRYTRASMREVLQADYVRTARAKGLKEMFVIIRHMFPNALLPLVTLIGLSIPFLFSGAILIEKIFAWPGLGQLAVDSVGKRDYPVIMGFNLMIAALVLLFNLITDIFYSFVDPRIRTE